MPIFHFQAMDIILGLGLFLLLGFFGGKLANRLKFPAVTGYLMAGFLISPNLLHFIPKNVIDSLSPLTNFALGLIAMTIGGRLSIKGLKKLGKVISYVTIGEVSVSFFLVFSLTFILAPFCLPGFSGWPSVYVLKVYILPLALLLGAIAPATAPAATIAVINEYRAKGPLTDTLLAVVAVDDALGIILFSIIFALAEILVGKGAGHPFVIILRSIVEIFSSVALGLLIGWVLGYVARNLRERSELLIVVLGAVMLTTGLAHVLGLSLLLANMALGFIVINKAERSQRIFGTIAGIEMPIYVAFFVLAGTHLNIFLLRTMGVLGFIYLLARGGGQILGARWGAMRAKAPEVVQKYLGFGLIPQAGVAIGLVLFVQQEESFQHFSGIISVVVLAGVVVNEIIGPLLTKMAIIKAKEAQGRVREEEQDLL